MKKVIAEVIIEFYSSTQVYLLFINDEYIFYIIRNKVLKNVYLKNIKPNKSYSGSIKLYYKQSHCIPEKILDLLNSDDIYNLNIGVKLLLNDINVKLLDDD